MKTTNTTAFLKKYVMSNIPYALVFWIFCKFGEAYRLAPGVDFLQKLIKSMSTFNAAMAKPMPSFDFFDLTVGLAGAVIVYVMVYVKKKNAKKWRKDVVC